MKRKIGLKKLLITAVTILLGILIISVVYFYQAVGELNNNSKIASRNKIGRASCRERVS